MSASHIVRTEMKHTILLLAALGLAGALQAQEAGRIHRTEVIPYDTRHDAEAHNRAGVEAYREFKPRMLAAEGELVIAGQSIEIPYAWTDGNVSEKEAGITIFLRSRIGITLTNDGAEFLGYARQVIQQMELLEDRYVTNLPGKVHLEYLLSTILLRKTLLWS